MLDLEATVFLASVAHAVLLMCVASRCVWKSTWLLSDVSQPLYPWTQGCYTNLLLCFGHKLASLSVASH